VITLTVTAKGQVTLKQDLLKHLGVVPGEKIAADKLPDGRIVVRAATQDGTIADFIGCLAQRGGRKLTIDKMNEITVGGWAKAKRKSRRIQTCSLELLFKTNRAKPGSQRRS